MLQSNLMSSIVKAEENRHVAYKMFTVSAKMTDKIKDPALVCE